MCPLIPDATAYTGEAKASMYLVALMLRHRQTRRTLCRRRGDHLAAASGIRDLEALPPI